MLVYVRTRTQARTLPRGSSYHFYRRRHKSLYLEALPCSIHEHRHHKDTNMHSTHRLFIHFHIQKHASISRPFPSLLNSPHEKTSFKPRSHTHTQRCNIPRGTSPSLC